MRHLVYAIAMITSWSLASAHSIICQTIRMSIVCLPSKKRLCNLDELGEPILA